MKFLRRRNPKSGIMARTGATSMEGDPGSANKSDIDLMPDPQEDPMTDVKKRIRFGNANAWIIRLSDIVFSVIGLGLTAPFFPIIAILIKIDSKGPVFVSVPRIGKGRKPFPMFKFRTLLETSFKIEQSVCPHNDPRITAVGRILRRTKLNELPQLFNVLRGDMALVGPRPEAPDLADMYPDEAKEILEAKPGLFGPVVIAELKDETRGRNEEDMYPTGVDPKRYYIEHILPKKLRIDLDYFSHLTIARYYRIIILAAKETVFGAFGTRRAGDAMRRTYLFMGDLAFSQLSYALAFFLHARVRGDVDAAEGFFVGFLLVIVVRSVLYYAAGLHDFVLELITPRDVFSVSPAVALGSAIMLGFDYILRARPYPPSVAILDFGILSVALTGTRLLLIARFRANGKALAEDRRPRVLIFGANRNGLAALMALGGSKDGPCRVIGFVDDAEDKYGKKIHGVKVRGNRYHIKALSVLYDVQEVILAPEGETREQIAEIVSLCVRAGLRHRLFSADREDPARLHFSSPLRPTVLSDILPQVPVRLDEPALRTLLTDRTVLMLNSGGQLGAAICRNVFKCGGKKVVIVDRSESHLNEVLPELRNDLPGFQIVPLVLDGRDINALDAAFARHRPNIVIHGGMRKFMTVEPVDNDEVAKCNYFRTFNLAKVASRHECEYFVLISSIRATARDGFLTESLRVAEIALNAYFSRTPVRLVVSRVGNIIENRGGIVSWLLDQIQAQGPLLLPSEKARTYLLSKHSAARAILQALVTGSKVSPGGVLMTSEPGVGLTFGEVAGKIAKLYGLKVGEDLAIRYGVVRDGLIDDEPASVAASRIGMGPLETGPGREKEHLVIERMLTPDTLELTEQDWRRRTDEIISLFPASPGPTTGPSLPPGPDAGMRPL